MKIKNINCVPIINSEHMSIINSEHMPIISSEDNKNQGFNIRYSPKSEAGKKLKSKIKSFKSSHQELFRQLKYQVKFGDLTTNNEPKIYYYKPIPRGKNDYSEATKVSLDGKNDVHCPLVFDTEFFQALRGRRLGVTGQVKEWGSVRKGNIFVHPDQVEYARETNRLHKLRHLKSDTGCFFQDYQKLCGHKNVRLKAKDMVRKEDMNTGEKLPAITFVMYSHFALAKLFMLFTSEFRDLFIEHLTEDNFYKCDLRRRLRVYTESKGIPVSDGIELPIHLHIDGFIYRFRLKIVDSYAVQGAKSYRDLAKSCGVRLESKDLLSKEDLENMRDTFFDKELEFDEYALGDLKVDEILYRHGQLVKKLYDSVGIGDRYQEPALTTGKTVENFFKSKLFDHIGIKPLGSGANKEENKAIKEEIDTLLGLISHGNPSSFKDKIYDSSCLNSKVVGGRCRNNKPTNIGIYDSRIRYIEKNNLSRISRNLLTGKPTEIYVDNDVMSAYGTGLRIQDYPIGKPIIEKYSLTTNKLSGKITLREWLKLRKYNSKKEACELVPGLWQAIVSTKEIDPENNLWAELEIDQDFLLSWFDFRYKQVGERESDTESSGKEVGVKTGFVKILNKQIVQATITEDFLEWLFKVCSRDQKAELLDNLYIDTCVYYPAYAEVDSYEEVKKLNKEWLGVNTTYSVRDEVTNSGKIVSTTKECNAWYRINLGELVIDDLLSWRAYYKKVEGKKCPLELLFKLFTNAHYGDFCSEHLQISNVVVGNNITSRCRAICWYMEKALNAWQSITDGSVLDLNLTAYPRIKNRRITAENFVNLYAHDPRDKNIKLVPIGGYEFIEIDDTPTERILSEAENPEKLPYLETIWLRCWKDNTTFETIKNVPEWLSQKLMEHVQNTFPGVELLHQHCEALKVSIGKDKPIKDYVPQKGMCSFEIKDIYTMAIFYSSSNYMLGNRMRQVIAVRSYQSTNHKAWILDNNDRIVESSLYDYQAPTEFYFNQLVNYEKVIRSLPFSKRSILKYNQYNKNQNKYYRLGLVAGDTINKVGLLREFNLSQFTFNSVTQYLCIYKETESNKRLYNQSYEGYFTNDDGTLDYRKMILEIDYLIRNGCLSLNKVLDNSRNRSRDRDMVHPHGETLDGLRTMLAGEDINQENSDDEVELFPEQFDDGFEY